MFFPHHPDNVAQQASPALQPEPHSKINDTGKRVGLSSLGFDAPPPPATSPLASGFLEVIEEMRKW